MPEKQIAWVLQLGENFLSTQEGRPAWTKNGEKAIRFSRKPDAEAIRDIVKVKGIPVQYEFD